MPLAGTEPAIPGVEEDRAAANKSLTTSAFERCESYGGWGGGGYLNCGILQADIGVLWCVAGNVSDEPVASIFRAEYEGTLSSETVTHAKLRCVFQKTMCVSGMLTVVSSVAHEHI